MITLSTASLGSVLARDPARQISRTALLNVADLPPGEPAPPSGLQDLIARKSTEPKPATAQADDAPAYKKVWFWALTIGLIGGTVALVKWAAKPTNEPPRPCPSGVSACFGDGRNVP